MTNGANKWSKADRAWKAANRDKVLEYKRRYYHRRKAKLAGVPQYPAWLTGARSEAAVSRLPGGMHRQERRA